jgi:hypothetical protein
MKKKQLLLLTPVNIIPKGLKMSFVQNEFLSDFFDPA